MSVGLPEDEAEAMVEDFFEDNACFECDGTGKLDMATESDDEDLQTCPHCRGSGVEEDL